MRDESLYLSDQKDNHNLQSSFSMLIIAYLIQEKIEITFYLRESQ